jgi:pimeloyl-ACP methyl ester carboxylesterase
MRFAAHFFIIVLLSALPSPIAAQEDVPRFEPSDCVVDVLPEAASRVRCGYLVVPESRAPDADPTDTIRLPVAIIASTGDNPAPDPLIYPTNGGPGVSTLISLPSWSVTSWVLPYRDIILVEQRGTEYAQPNLNCPEIFSAEVSGFGFVLSREEEIALTAEAAKTCRERLVNAGVNLSGYNSAESAADLADLRQVLGYDQWNLFGLSYGGRLALTVMRDHPAGLRSVVLDSVYTSILNRYEEIPKSFVQAFDRMLMACRADAACAVAYPDLEPDLYSVVDEWNAQPRRVVIRHPLTGEPFEVNFTGDDLVNTIFGSMYAPTQIPFLPFLIDQFARGNDDLVFPLVQESLGGPSIEAAGMTFSVECQEEIPFNDRDQIADIHAAHPLLRHFTAFRNYPAICDVWDVPPSDPVENEPVASDIPTLILGGEFDPIHPGYWGEAAAETLSDFYYYEFPGMAHGQMVWHGCPAKMAEDFINDPTIAPDAVCMESMPPPDFITSGELYPTSAAYHLNTGVVEGDNPPLTALLAFCALLFAAGVVVLPILWIGTWRSGAARRGHWAYILVVLAAGLNIAFIVLTMRALSGGDPLMLTYGLPPRASRWLFLPAVTSLLTIAGIVALVLAWTRRYWTRPRRIFFSLVVIACAAFSVWLLGSNLLPIRL